MLQTYTVTFHNADGTTVNGELETDAVLPTVEGWTITPNAAGGYDAVPVGGTPPPTAAAAPTFVPPAGTYTTPQHVALACPTPGSSIYYTLDGSTPTAASNL